MSDIGPLSRWQRRWEYQAANRNQRLRHILGREKETRSRDQNNVKQRTYGNAIAMYRLVKEIIAATAENVWAWPPRRNGIVLWNSIPFPSYRCCRREQKSSNLRMQANNGVSSLGWSMPNLGKIMSSSGRKDRKINVKRRNCIDKTESLDWRSLIFRANRDHMLGKVPKGNFGVE